MKVLTELPGVITTALPLGISDALVKSARITMPPMVSVLNPTGFWSYAFKASINVLLNPSLSTFTAEC